MIWRSVLLVFSSMSLLAWMHANGSDVLTVQREALAESLELPLRAQLVKNGYTPRNAAMAASSLLDKYAQCLATTQSTDMDSEPEVSTVRLGDAVVTAYKSHCLTKFLDTVAHLP
jgi:hypothetical protein